MNHLIPDGDQSIAPAADEQPSQAVVETVAAAEGVDQTDLRPLFSVVDPDALDSLFQSRSGDEREGQIRFTYHGYRVCVHRDGDVTLADA